MICQTVAVLRARELVIVLINEDLIHLPEVTISQAIKTLNALKAATTTAEGSSAIDGFIQDVAGQVTEAVTVAAYYQKWGAPLLA